MNTFIRLALSVAPSIWRAVMKLRCPYCDGDGEVGLRKYSWENESNLLTVTCSHCGGKGWRID
jgi:DnaJ-class molecular chaperone